MIKKHKHNPIIVAETEDITGNVLHRQIRCKKCFKLMSERDMQKRIVKDEEKKGELIVWLIFLLLGLGFGYSYLITGWYGLPILLGMKHCECGFANCTCFAPLIFAVLNAGLIILLALFSEGKDF